ncbi:hypothetical protein [Cohnella laeviribosi]|uniref:hypothetical protein n=1 Tax=Cohnella laeviribosi TaxID=380174 RepID=UPI000371ED80|nr:hypothetical protein [Cohnella laeviribosi]
MMVDLIWIVAAYAAAACCVRWWSARKGGAGEKESHFVLVAGNHQMQIEGYVRALRHFAWRTGREVGITIVLEPSSVDDTGKIASLLASRTDGGVGVVRGWSSSVEKGGQAGGAAMERLPLGIPPQRRLVWVNLSNEEHLRLLPR